MEKIITIKGFEKSWEIVANNVGIKFDSGMFKKAYGSCNIYVIQLDPNWVEKNSSSIIKEIEEEFNYYSGGCMRMKFEENTNTLYISTHLASIKNSFSLVAVGSGKDKVVWTGDNYPQDWALVEAWKKVQADSSLSNTTTCLELRIVGEKDRIYFPKKLNALLESGIYG